jgi:hypothetical protein
VQCINIDALQTRSLNFCSLQDFIPVSEFTFYKDSNNYSIKDHGSSIAGMKCYQDQILQG